MRPSDLDRVEQDPVQQDPTGQALSGLRDVPVPPSALAPASAVRALGDRRRRRARAATTLSAVAVLAGAVAVGGTVLGGAGDRVELVVAEPAPDLPPLRSAGPAGPGGATSPAPATPADPPPASGGPAPQAAPPSPDAGSPAAVTPPQPSAVVESHFGYLAEVRGSGDAVELVLDPARLLTGQEAHDAAVAEGQEPLDWYIDNAPGEYVTYRLAPGARVLGSQALVGEPGPVASTVERLREVVAAGQALTPFTLRVGEDGQVVAVEELYLP